MKKDNKPRFIPCGDSLEKMEEIKEEKLENVSGGINPDIVSDPNLVLANEYFYVVGEESDMDRHAGWGNPSSSIYSSTDAAKSNGN